MLKDNNGLLETLILALATVVTWIFTPKTRKKLAEVMTGKVNSLGTLLKVKGEIAAFVPSTSVATFIFGQFMHETNNGTSKIFKENKNMFGMKHPYKRPTLSVDAKNGYAAYGSTQDSIHDLLLWLEYAKIDLNKITDVESYVAALKANSYFEDSYENYLNGVRAGAAKFFQVL